MRHLIRGLVIWYGALLAVLAGALERWAPWWLLLALLTIPLPLRAAGPTLRWDGPVDRYVIECAAAQTGPWQGCGEVPIPLPTWQAPEGSGPCYRVRSAAGDQISASSTNVWCAPQPPDDLDGTVPTPPGTPPGPYPLLTRTAAWHATASSQSGGAESYRAIDGSLTSAWRTPTGVTLPQWLRLDVGHVVWLDGVFLTPRADTRAGDITAYTLAVSTDGATWTTVAEGTWPSDATAKGVRWSAVKGRYVRVEAKATAGFAAIAELGVYGQEVTP